MAQAILCLTLVLSITISPTLAAGPTQPVGPQEHVGPTELVGPQEHVGPTQSVGPQEPAELNTSETAAPVSSTTSGGQGNTSTGSDSNNQNSSSNSTNSNTSTTNNAAINNGVNANLSTGKNNINQNTKVDSVKTGDIDGAVNLVNIANSNLGTGSTIANSSLNAGSDKQIVLQNSNNRSALNSNTGADSNNTNTSTNSGNFNVVAVNNASADNNINVNADTGSNVLNENTAVGGIKTGNVNLAVNVINILNADMPDTDLNVDVWNVLTDNPDSIIIVPESNSSTGANSNNTNSGTSNVNKGITVNQNATADNSIQVNATTGDNTIDKNSTIGNVTTGTANVDGSLVTIANPETPVFYILNVFGDWNGSLQGMPAGSYIINKVNDGTGANSNNTNSDTSNNNYNTSITNNASVQNGLVINANTGGNDFNKNTIIGDISTGSINVVANVVNMLNSWGSIPNFHLGIINIFSKPAGTAQNATAPVNQTEVSTNPEPITDVNVGVAGSTTTQQPTSQVASNHNVALGSQVASVTVSADSQEDVRTLAQADTMSLNNNPITLGASSTNLPKSSNKATTILILAILSLLAWAGIELAAKIAKKRSL